MRASPVTRFVARILAWLPLAFVVWYFTAPLLLWPVKLLVEAVSRLAFGNLVRALEQHAAVVTFVTTLKPGDARAASGEITVDVSLLLYSFGLPLYAALVVATREPGWPRRLALGSVAMMPFIAWGVVADFLKTVAIASGPLVASQTGFVAWQRGHRLCVPVRLADPADGRAGDCVGGHPSQLSRAIAGTALNEARTRDRSAARSPGAQGRRAGAPGAAAAVA
jgi:hypothetical protein